MQRQAACHSGRALARLAAALLTLLLAGVSQTRAELSATDDFQSYGASGITDQSGGSGDWTTNWTGCSQFDGGTYRSTDSKIDGTQSYGLYGSGGGNGTGVRRRFTSTGGQMRFGWSYRADYDVTSDDGNGGLSRRLAYTLRNGFDADHFSGQRLSFFFAEGSANFAWYDGTDRNTNAVTFTSGHVYDCSVTVSTGQRTYALSVSNRNNAAKFSYTGSWTTGTAGDNLDSVSFLMRGPGGAGNDAFLDSVSVSQVGVPWPGGTSGGYASDPASKIHHYKEEAVLGNGYILAMIDLNGSLYDLYFPSIGLRQGSGTANEGYKGPEEFIGGPFGCGSLDAQANGQMNVINGMGGIGLIRGGTNSIHWLKNQVGTDYTNIGQKWTSDDTLVTLTTNKLNITSNNILVQQYDFVPSTDAIPAVVGGTRTNFGVYVKRFLLTNLESTTNTFDFYYDINYNVKGANDNDVMYWVSSNSTMVVRDNGVRFVNGQGCDANGYGGTSGSEYKMASYAGDYLKSNSVFFSTTMKLVTNSTTGAGVGADGSWRDHTATDSQEGWMGKRITLAPGQTNEVDVLIVGSWDDQSGQTGTHDYWGVPVVSWFYTNNMATVQSTTDTYWSNWLNSGVTIDFPGSYYDAMFKRQLLVSIIHQDKATGAIIAGSHNGAYPFSWPRDGCYAAIAFGRVGHTNAATAYLRFLKDSAYRDTSSGYPSHLFQKYSTDGYRVWSAAQPDESASVPWAVYYYYLLTGDGAYLTNNAELAISNARASSEDSPYDGNLYYDDPNNLIHGNNVWEDSNDDFIYSNAAIVRGLRDAANAAEYVGNTTTASVFRARANTIVTGINARIDSRVEPADISHMGMVVPYEAYEPNDARMTNMVEWIHGRQSAGTCGTCSGGPFTDNLVETGSSPYEDSKGLVNRYAHNIYGNTDNYWNTASGAYLHSPWFLATSWYGMYFARWQDYLPGKNLVTTNLYTLNLLTNKMTQMMIGAEQIAPKADLQKYTGFWLQTSWPNLWEADMTLVDQMMMFLDYKPQATNNTCYFAPKLPISWDRIAFNNMMFKNQRFDISVAETNLAPQVTTNVVSYLNKRNTGTFNCDIYLRVPVDQITNANHIIVALTNEFTAGNSLNGFTSSVNSNTGAIRVNGPLYNATGTNNIAVYPDSEKQGVPDFWKAQHGFAPTAAATSNMVNGMTLKQAYLAGVDPTVANTRFAISNVTVSAAGTINVTWRSTQDSTTVPRLYDVYRAQGPFTNGATWTRISQNVASAGLTTAISEDISAATITQRFYRVTVAGRTNDAATAEIVGVHKHRLVEGNNYISLSTLPGANTLLSVLGTNQLAQGSTESTATTVDIWDQTNQNFSNSNRYWLDTGTNGWKQSNTTTPSNGVLLDPNKGLIVTVRSGAGNQTLRTVGFVPTNNQVQVVFSNGYSVASSTFPTPVTLANSGLIASGFVGGTSKVSSDVLYFFNPSSQQFDDQIWYRTSDTTWYDSSGNAATRVIQPGEGFLIRRRARTTNMSWTNTVPYTVPFTAP